MDNTRALSDANIATAASGSDGVTSSGASAGIGWMTRARSLRTAGSQQRRAGTASRSGGSRKLTVLAAGSILLALTGCSTSQNPAQSAGPAYAGDTLTFATSQVPPSLNPAVGDPAYALLYQWAYDPLVILNGDGTYSGGLAEKWGYVGEGNMSYELTLRDGVKFSDGEVLDAEALKTYLDYERSQTLGTPATLLASVASVDVIDPLSVRLTLSRPDPGLTFYFAQAFGAGYVTSPEALDDPTSLDAATAGAGPYMLDPAQTVTNDHYTFVQNPNYWNPDRQHWKSVTVRVITNASSTIQALQSGQVQAALGDATTVSAAENAGLTVTAPPQALSGINLADRGGQVSEPLGDVRVRQALNMAIDRKAIAKALYGSEDLALSQYALEGQPGYDEALNDAYPYDPKKAKELLAEAGYPDGFTLPVLTSSLAGLEKLNQAMAGQLAEVGVTLDLTSKATAPDYFSSMTSGEFPAAAISYGLANMNSLDAGFVNAAGPFNWFKTVDPELDALYAQYRTADEETGATLEKQINERLVDQAWAIPVVGAPLSYYTVQGIEGLEATPANSGTPLITDLSSTK